MLQYLVDDPNQKPDLDKYAQDYLASEEIQHKLFEEGQKGFACSGRGVVVVDMSRFAAHTVRIFYLSAGRTGGLQNSWNDREMAEICQSYDPEQEIILFVHFGEGSLRNECYKLALNSN